MQQSASQTDITTQKLGYTDGWSIQEIYSESSWRRKAACQSFDVTVKRESSDEGDGVDAANQRPGLSNGLVRQRERSGASLAAQEGRSREREQHGDDPTNQSGCGPLWWSSGTQVSQPSLCQLCFGVNQEPLNRVFRAASRPREYYKTFTIYVI
jgi:hypothetical protein